MKHTLNIQDRQLKFWGGMLLCALTSQAYATTTTPDAANININANIDNAGDEGVFITSNGASSDGNVSNSAASIAITSNSGTNGLVTINSQSGTTINNGLSLTNGVLNQSGGITSINSNSNFATNINTGTSTGTVTIGNTGATSHIDSLAGNASATLTNNQAQLGISSGGSYTASDTAAITAFAANTLSVNSTSINGSAGNSSLSIANNQASLQSNTGGTGFSTYTVAQQIVGTTTKGIAGNHYVLENNDAATQAIITGASVQNVIQGNTLVDGNMYINGALAYTSNNAANTTVSSGTSVLANSTQNTQGQMSIVNQGGAGYTVNGNGQIQASNAVNQSTASLTLTNGLGNTHGIVVQENQTTISGGSQSSSMILNNNGASFSNAQNGSAIQLHGVANGSVGSDAANISQLNSVATRAYSGIAQIAAMQAVPAPVAGKNYSIGVGGGFYAGQQAIAFGAKANISDSINVAASVSNGFGSNSDLAASVGAGYSF